MHSANQPVYVYAQVREDPRNPGIADVDIDVMTPVQYGIMFTGVPGGNMIVNTRILIRWIMSIRDASADMWTQHRFRTNAGPHIWRETSEELFRYMGLLRRRPVRLGIRYFLMMNQEVPKVYRLTERGHGEFTNKKGHLDQTISNRGLRYGLL